MKKTTSVTEDRKRGWVRLEDIFSSVEEVYKKSKTDEHARSLIKEANRIWEKVSISV